jgi:hypothetical protein
VQGIERFKKAAAEVKDGVLGAQVCLNRELPLVLFFMQSVLRENLAFGDDLISFAFKISNLIADVCKENSLSLHELDCLVGCRMPSFCGIPLVFPLI